MSEPTSANHFFLDAVKYETQKIALSGLEIKGFNATIPITYQLFLEEDGDTPDRQISDGETVTLHDKTKHFYAVPPATFGEG